MSDMQDFDQVVERLPKLFDTLSDKLPQIIGAVKKELFSPEAGKEMGKAVGAFYGELIAAGMTPEQAVSLTKDYMKTIEMFGQQMKTGNA